MQSNRIQGLAASMVDTIRGQIDSERPITDTRLEGLRSCAVRFAREAIALITAGTAPTVACAQGAEAATASALDAQSTEADATALQPGQIPAEPLPPARTAPIELRIEIAGNARAGEPYQAALCVETRDGRAVSVTEVQIPADSGVRHEAGQLVAQQPVAGEYRITVTATLEGPPTVAGLTGETTLIVNPDPRDLWKNIPSDRDAQGWKADIAYATCPAAGGRTLLAASVRGRSHAHVGSFRDDDFALAVSESGSWNVAAVADGAGSAKRSRIGSRVAAETAVAVAAHQLEREDGEALFTLALQGDASEQGLRTAAYRVIAPAVFEAVKALEAKAKAHEMAVREYATTLLLVLHRRLNGNELLVTYQVGDGAMAALPKDAAPVLIGRPEGGEFSGQTRFLERDVVRDAEAIASRIQIHRLGTLEAVLMMTDGVSDPKFPSEAELANPARWEALYDEILAALDGTQDPQQLADWLGFHATGHHDDRTLLVLR